MKVGFDGGKNLFGAFECNNLNLIAKLFGVVSPHGFDIGKVGQIMCGVFSIKQLPIWNDTHERGRTCLQIEEHLSVRLLLPQREFLWETTKTLMRKHQEKGNVNRENFCA